MHVDVMCVLQIMSFILLDLILLFSNMSIITRHKTASVGTRLEFDHNGKITSQQKQARQVIPVHCLLLLLGSVKLNILNGCESVFQICVFSLCI